jgi:hypothetical protein
MNIPTIDIDTEGNITTIYKDDLCLRELGIIYGVRRASWIHFNELSQEWVVINSTNNVPVYSDKNRDKCVEWEIENFGPGGKYCHY